VVSVSKIDPTPEPYSHLPRRKNQTEDEAAVLDMFSHIEEDSEFEEYRDHPQPV